MILSLLFFFSLVLSQDIKINLTEPRSSEFLNWCSIELSEDHHGWSANQPLNEWASIVVNIKPKWNITKIQMTACDSHGNAGNGRAARIRDPSFTTILYFALEYWNGPWKLYINFPECHYQIWPGIVPE